MSLQRDEVKPIYIIKDSVWADANSNLINNIQSKDVNMGWTNEYMYWMVYMS